ncbi:MAG: hypothetical protein H7235_07980 [Bdellovibrionaceae bacterium]|nr:hypothetical protein [Pseudobdellovibrionaceae bacterium]
MNDVKKNKDQSPLVQSVLSLDTHFESLKRLSGRIEEIELASEFDFNQARQLMKRFAESAQAVSTEIVELANLLNQARINAETTGKIVAAKAEQMQNRQNQENQKLNLFRTLTEKVSLINEALKSLKKEDGEEILEKDRENIKNKMAEINLQLQPLIEEAIHLKNEARISKMKVLEQNADSLSQSLIAVSQKLAPFQTTIQ